MDTAGDGVLASFGARCQIGLGLIAASKGRHAEAAIHLRAGLDAARREDLNSLAARAERAIAALPTEL